MKVFGNFREGFGGAGFGVGVSYPITPPASTTVHSKAMVILLFILCLYLLRFFLFGPCFAVQYFNCVLSSFAIILLG